LNTSSGRRHRPPGDAVGGIDRNGLTVQRGSSGIPASCSTAQPSRCIHLRFHPAGSSVPRPISRPRLVPGLRSSPAFPPGARCGRVVACTTGRLASSPPTRWPVPGRGGGRRHARYCTPEAAVGSDRASQPTSIRSRISDRLNGVARGRASSKAANRPLKSGSKLLADGSPSSRVVLGSPASRTWVQSWPGWQPSKRNAG
jgi:hypothetical protein